MWLEAAIVVGEDLSCVLQGMQTWGPFGYGLFRFSLLVSLVERWK